MEKLTIQHIAPYLPYGLKIQHKNDIYEATALSKDNIYFKGGLVQISDENTKPHLFPISCLTKNIQHGGREFIPLIELAKIEGFYNFANGYLPIDRVGRTEVVGISDNVTSFSYCEKYNNFFLMKDKRAFTVKNQYQLFQKLAEWHINFVGIPEGLYIDKNTLK